MAELLSARGGRLAERESPRAIESRPDAALVSYLQSQAGKAFAWGELDCALFVADWVKIARGHDGAVWFRGRYSTEGEAKAYVDHNGLVSLLADCCMAIGVRRTGKAEIGDFGVVERAGRQICAIRTAGGWAMMAKRGIMSTPHVEVLAVWQIAPRPGDPAPLGFCVGHDSVTAILSGLAAGSRNASREAYIDG